MNRYLILTGAVMLVSSSALAQTTDNVGNPAVKDSAPHRAAAVSHGANSFTQGQARKRLAKAGYVVSQLTKDANGVWTGSATKGGKTVTVGLDFKGNITER